MAEFKVGDVVKLKSGSPHMTVTGDAEMGEYACEWFEKREPKFHRFPGEALIKVDLSEPKVTHRGGQAVPWLDRVRR